MKGRSRFAAMKSIVRSPIQVEIAFVCAAASLSVLLWLLYRRSA